MLSDISKWFLRDEVELNCLSSSSERESAVFTFFSPSSITREGKQNKTHNLSLCFSWSKQRPFKSNLEPTLKHHHLCAYQCCRHGDHRRTEEQSNFQQTWECRENIYCQRMLCVKKGVGSAKGKNPWVLINCPNIVYKIWPAHANCLPVGYFLEKCELPCFKKVNPNTTSYFLAWQDPVESTSWQV